MTVNNDHVNMFFVFKAEAFDGSGAPVIACKGARLSDYGGEAAICIDCIQN